MRLRAVAVTTRLPSATVPVSEPFLPFKSSSTEIAESNFSTWYCASFRSSRSCWSALVRLAIVSLRELMQRIIVKLLTIWVHATAPCSLCLNSVLPMANSMATKLAHPTDDLVRATQLR